MPKVKPGKETVKFLAIFDHMSSFAFSSAFSLLPAVKSRVLTLRRFNALTIPSLNCYLRMASEFRLMTPLSGEEQSRNVENLLVCCNSNDFTVGALSPSDGERVRVRGSL
jgi:hypothetical protein